MTRALRAVDGDGLDGPPPPHNIAAEQAVLGAVMLSPAALAEVRAIIDGTEFYRPAHALIWETVTALADRGEPHDPLTVGAALGRDITRTGGAPYLHTLIASVPTAANGGYYAHIIRDLAYARRVIETGTRLVQLGEGNTNDPAGLRGAVTAETAALAEADRRGWPDPVPLSAAPEVPGFPLWALPGWLGEYAACVAEVTQTPADLAGCLALAVLAVAASGKVWIDAGAWTEPTCLYVVVVLPPGNRKSEVFRAMTAPLRAAERTLIDAARPRIAEALIRRKIAEASADRTARAAETAAADPASPDRTTAALIDAAEARLELDNTAIPAEPCLFADDTTIERLGSRLAEQGGRFAVLSPEGEIFSIAAGRYSGTPNLGILKQAHAGEPARVERQTRTEHIDQATLTLGICTQPGVLTRLGDTPEFREQGLLARVLYSVPESRLGWRNPSPDPVPPAVRDGYASTLTALTLSLDALTEPRTLTFTPDASRAVTRLLGAIEPRFRPGADLAHMTDWGGKLAGATIRIAALLHLAQHARDGWDRPVTTATLDAATQIGDYYTQHAKAAYDAIGADPATADARAILDWARNTRTSRFAARDILPSLRQRFAKVTDLNPALAILESRGWIRRLPAPPQQGRGRPAAPAWETHPEVTQ